MTAEFPLAFWPWKPPYEFISLIVRPHCASGRNLNLHYAPGFVNFLRNIADFSGDKDSFFLRMAITAVMNLT